MKNNFHYVTYNENEKYLLISFLRVGGIPFSCSGYYFNEKGQEGYYISFDLLPDQEKDIEDFLLLFDGCYNFPVELISEGAILRDHSSIDYSCLLHEKVTDIADSIYNVGDRIIKDFLPEYKAIYNFFGADYFKKVITDMAVIDAQLVDFYKVNELTGSYLDRLGDIKKVVLV